MWLAIFSAVGQKYLQQQILQILPQFTKIESSQGKGFLLQPQTPSSVTYDDVTSSFHAFCSLYSETATTS